MFGFEIDPIIDAALALVTVPAGMTKSPMKAEPPQYRPDTLYCWPLRAQDARSVQMDGGIHPEMWFFLRFAWSVGTGEARYLNRTPEVADAIDAGLQTVIQALLGTTNDVWEGIDLDRINRDAITTADVRAGHVDFSGYRLV